MRAQGKVEWSLRVLRNKISFDMATQKRSRTNWVKNLPNYMKCLNNKKPEEIGWQFSFEVYFARKSKKLVRCGFHENQGSPEVRKVLKPTKNDFSRFKKQRSKTRKRALNSDKTVAKRTVEYFRKRNKCSVYKINQKILARYGKKGKKAPKRRHVCIGKVEKVGKYDKYKVVFKDFVNNQKVPSSFSVEDIADLLVQRGSNKKLLEKNFTRDSEKWFNNQRINLINKATTYHSTHSVMETVNLVPFVVS